LVANWAATPRPWSHPLAVTVDSNDHLWVFDRCEEAGCTNSKASPVFELGADGKGVIVSQVVPFPWDASLQVVADYQAAIKPAGGEPDFVTLEGYLAGRLAIAALDKTGADVTREGLIKAIKETGKFDIGGLPMTFSAEKNEGLDKVFLTVIQADGSFKAVEKLVKVSSKD